MACVDRLEKLKKRLKDVRKAIDKRATDVWNMALTIDTAAKIRDEENDHTILYQGNESDLEDFRVSRNFVNAFIDVAARIDSLQIPQSQLDVLISETKAELIARFDDDEPPLDVAETFDKLVSIVKQKRKKASAEWMLQVKEQFTDIDGLTLQESENALRELNSPPPYFGGKKDVQARDVIVRKLEKHLERKVREWSGW